MDTLNEALRIAAMDIAEVAQGDENDNDEEGEGDEDSSLNSDGEDELGSSAGTSNKPSNKNAMMRAVMNDTINNFKSSNSAGHDVRQAPAAFLVHEDGSFEHK